MRLQGDAATQFGNNLRRMGGVPTQGGFGQPRQNGGINPGGMYGGNPGGFGGGWGRQNRGPMPPQGGPVRPPDGFNPPVDRPNGDLWGPGLGDGPGAGGFQGGGFRHYNSGGINPGGFGGGFGGGPYNPNVKPGQISGAQPDFGIRWNGERARDRFAPGELNPYGGGRPNFPAPEGGPGDPVRPPFEGPEDRPMPLPPNIFNHPRGNQGPLPPPPGPSRWDSFGTSPNRWQGDQQNDGPMIGAMPPWAKGGVTVPQFPLAEADPRFPEPGMSPMEATLPPWLMQPGLTRPQMV